MAGFDRHTGQPLDGFEHVCQSIEVIMTTWIGTRVMRRWFGGAGPVLLGRLMTSVEVGRFWALVVTAIHAFEPRYRVIRVTAISGGVEAVRRGELGFSIEGAWRPRAHLGDFTVAGIRTIDVGRLLRGT
jgi:uncharacterized protein